MKVIVCLDDRNGMLFNHRRQSRDRQVIQDMVGNLGGKRLWISPFSEKLFQGMEDCVQMADSPLEIAGPGECCFVEDLSLDPWADRVESLIVYRWNRHYPGDKFLDLDLSGWRLVSREEFPGSSHQKITKEVYEP
ncbi:MAG: ribonuclease Z [Acutalibacter sp.]|jgi:hypothetical protein